MDPDARVFISYRRDDAAGYAGRLEEALERRLGRGSVFRDVQDIAPGEDFAAAIRRHLAGAHTVLVLIGPRWAGGEAVGARRIDDERDMVRLEVQAALDAGVRVVPLLLPGAAMPDEPSLPAPLGRLARHQALPLGEAHWNADVNRLVAHIGVARARAVWPWAIGSAVAAAAAVATVCALRWVPIADPAPRLVGTWTAPVRYDWGDRRAERFEFKSHAGALAGSASFLGYPLPAEKLQFDGTNLRFETHSDESMGNERRTKTHAYSAELRQHSAGDILVFRLHTTGGFAAHGPIEFEARRIDDRRGADEAAGASASTRP